MDPILIGERIVLRKLRRSDEPLLVKYAASYKVARYTNVPHPYGKKEGHAFLLHTHRSMRKKKSYELCIELKESGELIGMCGISSIDWKNKRAETGYWLGEPHWGKGYASEALALLLEFGFRKLKLHRMYAGVYTPNVASAHVLEKAGFKREATLRHERLLKGKWLDKFIYEMLSSEYKKKQS